ncbi:hypothetical protein CSKR_113246 [Clonorchis sinensis]|uniref:Stabilizer of axonemal microtubules 2 n=2 Tax=Clonorchis sinensis TaxID=79923 RepID=A0A8T1ML68_CLOSI|nr:hypothetical protein CSKR_113246 [Clonorchis sinensis]
MGRRGAQCICEICCCGRHKCPHRPKAIEPWGPCVMSEYTAQYHPQCVEPNKVIVPPSNIFASGDPMSGKTTHRNDYVPHPYERPYVQKPIPYKAPCGKMEDSTLYRNEYTAKNCAPSLPVKPLERRMCSAKFDGQPTYRSDYRSWDLPPIRPQKPKDERPNLPKFEAEPIYRREFVPKCIEKPKSYKPEDRPRPDEPFRSDTMYRTEYVPRQVEPPVPVKPALYAKSQMPFETLTTNRKDFTPKEMCPNPPFKPQNLLFASTDPMSKATTNRTDYKDWGPSYPERGAKPEYKPLEGDQSFDSTYRNDFNEKPICPVVGIKPFEPKRCDAKFDGLTNYRHEYKPWEVPPPKPAKKEEWAPPDAPFDDSTTNRVSYVPHPCVVAPQPITPRPQCWYSGPFDDRTNYRTEYVPKEVCPCCPAGFLPTDHVSPDGYVFDHFDERGHQMYRNVTGDKTTLPALPVK